MPMATRLGLDHFGASLRALERREDLARILVTALRVLLEAAVNDRRAATDGTSTLNCGTGCSSMIVRDQLEPLEPFERAGARTPSRRTERRATTHRCGHPTCPFFKTSGAM